MRKRRLLPALIENLETRRLLANLLGVDAAGSYQFVLNWATVKADGYTFGWEKATQGTGGIQSLYPSNVSAAKAAGVAIGAYCFADFRDDPTVTANVFWNEIKSTVSGDGLTLQPMLDAENYNPTGMNLDSWVATWSSVLKADGAAAGVTLNPIIYSDSSFAADYFTTATSKNYPLWIAEPGSTAPTNSHTAPWTSYEVWQYGEATFPSSNGNVATDVDRLNGDANELKNLIVGEGKYAINSAVATTQAVTTTQNSNGTGTTHIVATNTIGSVVAGPVYYNNAWYFDIQFSPTVSGWVNQNFLTPSNAPTAPTITAPANNSVTNSVPTFTWNSDPSATTFSIYLNNSVVASGLTTTQFKPNTLADGSYTWYVQATNSTGSTYSSTWTFVLDTTSPPLTPTYSSPANNATLTTQPTLVWNADPTAQTYNVYFNNSEVASGLTTLQYAPPSSLSAGNYSWYIQAVNTNGPTSGAVWNFTLSNPAAPVNSSPANNAALTSSPTLTWATDPTATSYSVYLNNSLQASGLTTTSFATSNLAIGAYTWYVQAKNAIGTTNGTPTSFSIGLPLPIASYPTQVPTTGASVLDFVVGYSDAYASINTSTFDSNDVMVTGPNGYSQAATFISSSQPGNGPSRSATYEITAPHGVWDALANGTYTVTMNANQVEDTAGYYVAAGTLGTFTVNASFAYINSNSQLVLNATSSYPNISLLKSGSLWNASNGNVNIQFNPLGYTSVGFVGTSGNDSLSIYSAMTVPLSFNGGLGQDALNVYAGTLTFATDLGATTSALTLSTSGTARVNFSSSQHLAGLDPSSNSVVTLTSGAGIAVETQDLEINDAASVDVADNALIVYGSDPDTMTSYLQSGSDEGAWDGPGINSHVAGTQPGYTLGFAPASSISSTSINGVSFSSTAIVVRYTYDGDANLDETVNADDLSLMLLAAVQQQAAQNNNQPAPTVYYFNGDFNYDTTINPDDFLLLSLGSAVQNQQTLA